MVGYAQETHTVSKAENPRTVSVDYTQSLDDGETLTGTPVVEANGGLIVSSESVNTEPLTINRRTVQPGYAVQFQVNPTAATTGHHNVITRCGSTGSNTIEGRLCIQVIN